VACGWFGIQTWIGALAVDTLMATLWNGWADVGGHKAIAFGAFWLIELAIILRGIEGIRWLEQDRRAAAHRWQRRAADLGFDAGGGIGNVFSESSKLVTDDQSFWSLFAPGLAANIGYWITLSLNIPDFTRYARPEVAGGRPVAGDAGDDDRVLVRRHRRHRRDDRRLRRGDLGSRGARRAPARRRADPARPRDDIIVIAQLSTNMSGSWSTSYQRTGTRLRSSRSRTSCARRDPRSAIRRATP